MFCSLSPNGHTVGERGPGEGALDPPDATP